MVEQQTTRGERVENTGSENSNSINETLDLTNPGQIRRTCEPTLRRRNGDWTIEFVGDDISSRLWDEDAVSNLLQNATLGPSFGKRGSILLPSEVGMETDPDSLRLDTIAFIKRYVSLPDPFPMVAAIFVEHTWLYDAHDSTVYWRFRHPSPGKGKSRGLKTLAALCRRAIRISGSSTIAAVRRDLTQVQGTLFIDEFDPQSSRNSPWTVVLKTGFEWDSNDRVCVQRADEQWQAESFTLFGPKVTAQHHRFEDEALESRFIDCYMGERDPSVSLTIDYEEFDRDALELRNKYLWWRLNRLSEFQVNPALCSDILNDRSNQVALPLLALARDDRERAAIVTAVRTSQDRMLQDKRESPWGSIAEAILCVDETFPNLGGVHLLKTVADQTFDSTICSQTVGRCAREFDIATSRGNLGYRLHLTDRNRQELRDYLERN